MTKRVPGRLDGAVVLVTGASRGIGRAVAQRYATEGAQVVAVARTTGGLEELDDDIRAVGGLPATLVPMPSSTFSCMMGVATSHMAQISPLTMVKCVTKMAIYLEQVSPVRAMPTDYSAIQQMPPVSPNILPLNPLVPA